MKSFAFAAALVAAVNAAPFGYGYQAPKASISAASAAKATGSQMQSANNWDRWGRDQDYAEDVSFSKTDAKSYAAESYDEWDNKDDDKWGAQSWGKDRDAHGASSYGQAASAGDYNSYGNNGHANNNNAWTGASATQGAAKSGYDNDVWAKQAYGTDTDSRWGKSYDSVDAKSYGNESYARKIQADDDQWAEDYDRWNAKDAGNYGQAASYNAYGKGGVDASAASREGAAGVWAKNGSNWDRWGRDQDYAEDVSYDKTWAKSYGAESYDEWDNQDANKWGAQSWGKDRDVYGASSYGQAASAGDQNSYGQQGNGYGHEQHGYGQNNGWQGASQNYGAAQNGYDNDEWAKQASGSDFDSRWGKSYDSVNAKSYDNESYARKVQVDDDQWAQNDDQWNSGDYNGYGKAASAGYGKEDSYGYGHDDKYANQAASAQYGAGVWGKNQSGWDAWGRDQDLLINESYDKTNAKSYGAESYDEWDNKDDDKWGAESWGQDRDVYGASSYGKAASAGDYNGRSAQHGDYGYGGYGQQDQYGAADKQHGASAQYGAASGAYDNDVWAKQAYGLDTDSRWGKSYDSVDAKSYDNESYARSVQADDDQWAEKYNHYNSGDQNGYGKAASASYKAPEPKYQAPKASYGYQAPAYGYQAPAYGYQAPAYGYQAPKYEAPKASYGGWQAPAKASYGGYGGW